MVLLTFPGARIQLDWLYVAQTIVQRCGCGKWQQGGWKQRCPTVGRTRLLVPHGLLMAEGWLWEATGASCISVTLMAQFLTAGRG